MLQGGRIGSAKKDTLDITRDITETSMSNMDDLAPTAMEDDSNDGPDGMIPSECGVKNCRKEEEEVEDVVEEEERILQLMGVDQAVLHSIEKCGTVKFFFIFVLFHVVTSSALSLLTLQCLSILMLIYACD